MQQQVLCWTPYRWYSIVRVTFETAAGNLPLYYHMVNQSFINGNVTATGNTSRTVRLPSMETRLPMVRLHLVGSKDPSMFRVGRDLILNIPRKKVID